MLSTEIVHSVHALATEHVPGREIARRLKISEASVRRALQRDPNPVRKAPPSEHVPLRLSHPITPPSPCPETAPTWCRRLYASLLQRDLLDELDTLIVFADLDVDRTHLTLNVFAVDVLLGRLADVPEPIDLDAGIARLQDAFAWDDRLRTWCRDVAQAVEQ